jgi:hypothetical protein
MPLKLRDGRHAFLIDSGHFWEIVCEPKSTEGRIKCEDHHGLTSHATEFLEPAREIGPVVDGKDRE